MKRLAAIFLVISYSLLPYFAFSQNTKTISVNSGIDSPFGSLKTDKEDTNTVNSLNKLAREIINKGNYSTADSLARKALQLAEDLGFKKGQANAYNNIGLVYLTREDYSNAMKFFFVSLKIREDIGDKKGRASSYNNIGLVYWHQDDYIHALDDYFKALKISEEIGNRQSMGYAYGNIGNIYYRQRNYLEALKVESLGLKIEIEMGNKQGVGAAYCNIGNIYFDQGNYPEALRNWVYSLDIFKEVENKADLSNSYSNIGGLFTKQKKYGLAKKYLDSALALSKYIHSKGVTMEVYSNYADLDSNMNNYKAAYSDYRLYIVYRDSLKNDSIAKRIVIEQMNYEFDKKMDAEKAEQEKATILKDEETKRKNIIIYGIIILFVVSSALIVSMLQVKRKKEKALLILEKRHIEEELLNATRALGDYTRIMVEKTELLEQFKADTEKLKNELDKTKIEHLEHLNTATILTEEDWARFKSLFEQVHKGFFIRLKEKMPDLSQAEIRLVCLTRLKLGTKHMAGILGVSFDTIKKTRYRLRKKHGLSVDDDIDALIESV